MVKRAPTHCPAGFSIIELMVVLACIGLLLAIAAPRYTRHVDQAREVTLRQDLREMRVAIDQFKADQSRYPQNLEELVTRGYLRSLPVDPVTGRADTWTLVAAPGQGAGGIADLHSGAPGVGQDGSSYATW
jgi:general secretion pathway protein G